MTFKLGRLPRDYTRRALVFEDYLDASALPPVPAGTVDRASRVTSSPMYANGPDPTAPPQIAATGIGDCEFARIGHMIQSWTAYAGEEVTIPVDNIVKAYSACTGYVLGDESTDNGATTQDTLEYWRKTGVPDSTGRVHKIGAYAAFAQPANEVTLKTAVYIAGNVAVDINIPESAQTQFGQIWEWEPSSPIEGGHAIALAKVLDPIYTGIMEYWTWGALQRATLAFNQHYIADSWFVLSEDWIQSNGDSIDGFNMAKLVADMADIS
jgi:hypothetical protein